MVSIPAPPLVACAPVRPYGSRLPNPGEKRDPASYWDRDGFCGHEVQPVARMVKNTIFEPEPISEL
jgi:hypothetical protein